ncbi:MAG: TlpA disulfide reductase family protein [Saprospiraceae bacterium]
MKTKIYQLSLLMLLLNSACQKPPLDYETALSHCIVTHDSVTNTGERIIVGSNENCILGAQLPEFAGTTMDGKKIDKSYFEGKVSVINFWFEGCMPCEAEMPGFNKLVEKYKSQPVNFLAIGRDSPKDITDFLTAHPFNVDHIAYGQPIIEGNFQTRWGFPLTIVADKHLKILYAREGGRTDSLAITAIQSALTPVIDMALK